MNATVVSTIPIQIEATKPGIIPGTFTIPAAKKGEFTKLVVGVSYEYRMNPLREDSKDPIAIPIQPNIIAQSIVDDEKYSYQGIRSVPKVDGSIALPGIFWLEGEPTDVEIKNKHKGLLEQAHKNTNAWMQELVKIADDSWNKHRQRGMITDLSRIACTYLGLEKEWDVAVLLKNSGSCWACKGSIDPNAIICTHCKTIIDLVAYKANQDKFAVK